MFFRTYFCIYSKLSLELLNALNRKSRQGLQNQMSLSLVCVIFLYSCSVIFACLSTYHICHNRHFCDGHKHVYYVLGIDILYSICNENLIYLFDNLDVDCSSNLYILSAKYFHIPYIQLFFAYCHTVSNI